MSEQLTHHQQLQEEFNEVSEKAKAADEAIGATPYKNSIYTEAKDSFIQRKGIETFDKNGLHTEVSTAFDGRQIRAHVSEGGMHGRMIDSHSYESSGDEPNWVKKGREGTRTQLFTRTKEGERKTLESTNTLVATMVARIALKQANTQAEQVISDAQERKAA